MKNYIMLILITLILLFAPNFNSVAQEAEPLTIRDDFSGRDFPPEEYFKYWLDNIVSWIILSDEKDEFENLTSMEQKLTFIELFWLKRDPIPETFYNEFKEDYYNRLRYIDQNYSYGDNPGIQTHRGMMYSVLGKPDMIQENFTLPGGAYRSFDRFSRRGMIWVYSDVKGVHIPAYYQVLLLKFGSNRWEIVMDWWGQKSITDIMIDSGAMGYRGYVPSRLRKLLEDKRQSLVLNKDVEELMKRSAGLEKLKLNQGKASCSFVPTPESDRWGKLKCSILYQDLFFKVQNGMNSAELSGTAVMNVEGKLQTYLFDKIDLNLTDEDLKSKFDKALEIMTDITTKPDKSGKYQFVIEIHDPLSDAIYSGITEVEVK